ncbi:MAG: phosphatase PAP2 family protein [Acidimicrobiales bacterium]|nr:phosphatase PAP2 family protein [Acidimicrobiales bacterium]
MPAYALLLLPIFVDHLDPATEPRIDLTGTIALVAWVFAESGQTFGIVAIAGALLVVVATQPGQSRRGRFGKVAVMIAVSILVLYGGKLLNDHVVKPAIGVARPNIVQMADLEVLGMEADSFYELTGEARSEHLESIKTETGFGELMMRPEVRDHWVKETAFSRPSGHALAAMTFATFYLSMALSSLAGWRRWLFHLLVPWAVFVSLSRPILRVHWPADILIGGLVGIVVGAGGYLLTQLLLQRLGVSARATERSCATPRDTR